MKHTSFFCSLLGTVMLILVMVFWSLPGLDAVRSLALGTVLISLGFMFSHS